MLRSVHVENFRALREFRMSGLGRVNLLVGTNNCGKTSILEAIHLLVAEKTGPMFRSVARRGEVDVRRGHRLQVSHLFHGHGVQGGSWFRVRATNDGPARQLEARVDTRGEEASAAQLTMDGVASELSDARREGTPFQLRMTWTGVDVRTARPLALTRTGTVVSRWFDPDPDREPPQPVRLIATEGISKGETMALLDGAVLSPEEELVVAALQIIEPDIERLAAVGRAQDPNGEEIGEILVSVAGSRLPIGSMGDGIQRLLGLALALVGAKGGVLLVDEIDTGLHYTVLTKMWRLVLETAKRLDVQVFATTHSRDCFEALAEVADPQRDDVSLQRIERDRADAVGYSAGVLRQAAEHGIEVR